MKVGNKTSWSFKFSLKGLLLSCLFLLTSTFISFANTAQPVAAANDGTLTINFTVVRPKAPTNDAHRIGQTIKEGIINITLKKQNGNTLTGDSTANWYSLTSSNIVIPNLEPGVYDIKIEYNDKIAAQREGIDATWASGHLIATETGLNVVSGANRISIQASTEASAANADAKPCSTGTGLTGAAAWILCPITEIIINATDFIQTNLIVPYLSVSPLKTVDDPSTTANEDLIYKLWQPIRNLANIAFIIAFMAIIFSQATSIGLSNYGIKKLMPKLGIVVIGTNLSFFIVAFAIDAFNIFGAGISQLVMGVITQSSSCAGSTAVGTDIWKNLVVGGAALGTAILMVGTVIGPLLGLLGTVFLIVLIAVIVLILRQMVLIILVIISPLAFVAWLLPNTANYFTKWWQNLSKLLMMYPMIILLFASGKLIQTIISCGNYQLASGSAGSDQATEAIRIGLSAFAGALPLLGIPLTYAAGGNLMGKLGGMVTSRSNAAKAKAKENSGKLMKPLIGGAAMRMANSQNPYLKKSGLGFIAGRSKTVRKARTDSIIARNENEAKRAQEALIASSSTGTSLSDRLYRARAAGVGGEAGRARVMSSAQAVFDKRRKEELDDSMVVLSGLQTDMNISSKNYITALQNYLADPSNEDNDRVMVERQDANGNVYKTAATDANGNEFRFSQHSELLKASLNQAASQGEVTVIENARLIGSPTGNMSTSDFQSMLDDVIRINDGKLKEKGGYHLATQFDQAAGRSLAAPTTVGDQILVSETAKIKMQANRILAMAQSGAKSVAGMKAGVLIGTANALELKNANDPSIDQTERAARIAHNNQRTQLLTQLDQASAADSLKYGRTINYRTDLKTRLTEIANNPNTSDSSEATSALRRINNSL